MTLRPCVPLDPARDRSLAPPPQGHRDRRRARRARRGLAGAILFAALLALAQPGQAQDGGCAEPGMNGQCSEFGAIVMASQVDVRGEPVTVPVVVVLNTAYQDQDARWMLFSARSAAPGGSSPVTIGLGGFASDSGDVVTTRVEQPSPGELNVWVDTLDTPLGTPLTLNLLVGATERGAYRLETLVMAFDRGYTPVKDSAGQDATLYSFAMVGVNGETSAREGGGSFLDRAVPAAGAMPVLAALAAAGLALRRRSA